LWTCCEASIKILGKEHRNILNPKGNLALIYSSAERWEDAHEEEVLKENRKIMEEERPDTIKARDHLSTLCAKQGRIYELLRLSKRVLELRTQLLGDGHPDTSLAKTPLGSVYEEGNKIEGSIKLLGKTEDAMIRQLRNEHPNTISTSFYLAMAYLKGRHDESIRILQKVVDSKMKSLGRHHPRTVASVNPGNGSSKTARRYPILNRLSESSPSK
jgi:Tetratricopeptide repeat